MLALRACRPSLLVTARRPFSTTLTTRTAKADPSPLQELAASLGANPTGPPTAGPSGYPAPAKKPNPFSQEEVKAFLTEQPKYRLHCKSTRNNTITTFTDQNGGTVAWFSSGSCGFKRVNRSSYEAGYQCAVKMFRKIEEIAAQTPLQVDLFFKGFGQGRDAMHRALLTTEGERVRPLVASVTDRTPIKIGGTRAKKTRRL